MSTLIEETPAAAETATRDQPKAAKKAARAKRGAPVAPAKGKGGKKAKAAKKSARGAKKAGTEAKGSGARDGSKAATILELLKRPGGATSKELQKATGWMPHVEASQVEIEIGFLKLPKRAALHRNRPTSPIGLP